MKRSISVIQGSEIWMRPDFKWSKICWFANAPDFKWDMKLDNWLPFCQKPLQIRTKTFRF